MSAPGPAAPFTVRGALFDGHSSRAHDATVTVDGPALVVSVGGAETRFPFSALSLDPPLGSVRRVLKFAGGWRFETDDREAVERLETLLGRNRGLRLVNRLERRWTLALASVVTVLVAGLLFWQYGLPAAAKVAARATPPVMLAALDRQTMALLDRQFLKPSKLPAARRRALDAEFRRIAGDLDPAFAYRLNFRRSATLGANAFALPNGSVVVTDDLVALAKSDREILGVLAHEIGHVTHRHGARSLYQSAGLLLFVAMLTGDVTTASTLAGTLALGLVQNGYSREMEREADVTAGRYLMRRYGTTRPLRDMLARLEKDAGGPGLPDLLSTHPGVQARLDQLRAIEAEGR